MNKDNPSLEEEKLHAHDWQYAGETIDPKWTVVFIRFVCTCGEVLKVRERTNNKGE